MLLDTHPYEITDPSQSSNVYVKRQDGASYSGRVLADGETDANKE